jgi:hypothetical protein
MDANNLLACETPQALVGWILRWGAGCWHRTSLPPPARLCPYCKDTHAYPPVSKRKLRLIACACCRFVWRHLDDRGRQAVLVAERFAEGQTVLPELHAAYSSTVCCVASSAVLRLESEAARVAVQRVLEMLEAQGERARLSRRVDQERFAALDERDLSDVVRDLIDDPSHPAEIDPAWLDANGGQARAVASCIDHEGRFDELPVLADALEEAGCGDAQILEHARRPRHYRGCWLIDALLGKS